MFVYVCVYVCETEGESASMHACMGECADGVRYVRIHRVLSRSDDVALGVVLVLSCSARHVRCQHM